MNRLGHESSPYLLQHRDNPVDWYPWCDEAFETARERDVPVFLSIGYATCHWCHVMERESFMDSEVAALLNGGFVSIKVDREERSDIDHLYMSVCKMVARSCGWPLTVIMTPEKRPFFVATYLPKHSRLGRAGMLDLLPRIGELWNSDRESVESSAARITGALQRLGRSEVGSEGIGKETLRLAFDQLVERYDPEHGGFGSAPKFPAPHNLLFLLRYWYREQDARALDMVTHTLRSMRNGGIFDQVGWGFHRYSTDREWKLPHFEKMLYDQALHVMAYTEGYLATGDRGFADVAIEVAEYVQRELTSEEGAFYSAEDADSEGVEGKYYVWSLEEVREVLPDDLAQRVEVGFGLEHDGNFLDEATGIRPGENVLHRVGDVDSGQGAALLEEARLRMFERRRLRTRPLLDDKILTDWNGLMIAALAKLGAATGEERYVLQARKAAEFVRQNLTDERGHLSHRYRQGRSGIPGGLMDYAGLLWGLIELFHATYESKTLVRAVELARGMLELFWDDSEGGFFLASEEADHLVVRLKDFDDGAVPSGNSVALYCLTRLARLTGEPLFEETAARLLEVAAPSVRRFPSAFCGFLLGVEFLEGEPSEVVVTGPPDDPAVEDMLAALRQRYLPSTVSLVVAPGDDRLSLAAPFTSAFKPGVDRALAYVCRGHVCANPRQSAAGMLAEIGAG